MLFINNFLGLFIESAPYLLLGMFIAGVINQLVPKAWIERTLGQKNSILTAALIGAPLPLCSCSVIPVAMGIRRSGASKASTASFLVATPETGVDSIGITYALMGPVMAIARPIAAIASALITGACIALFGKSEQGPLATATATSCCHGKPAKVIGWKKNTQQIFIFGYGQLLRDFMLWLLVGLFFAALIQTLVPAGFLAQYGHGVFAMLLVVLISIPMYICATASTPVAVGLLLSGISPGAALVFMLTGPATNIATLMVIKNELGTRELFIYLCSIIVSAVIAGLSLDYFFQVFDWQLLLQHGAHSEMIGGFYQASALILAMLILYQVAKKYWPKLRAFTSG